MESVIEQVHRTVADALMLECHDIPLDTHLIELGLHSLMIMQLIVPLSALAQFRLDYADLARLPTVRGWADLVENHLNAK